MIHGTLAGKNEIYLTVFAGTANHPETGEFTLSISVCDSSPMITSKRSGKQWHLPWLELIQLAIQDGILIDEVSPKQLREVP